MSDVSQTFLFHSSTIEHQNQILFRIQILQYNTAVCAEIYKSHPLFIRIQSFVGIYDSNDDICLNALEMQNIFNDYSSKLMKYPDFQE